jgi:hypothetical protein
MARSPRTEIDTADRAPGYSGSGESKHTRRVSAPGGADPTYNSERRTWSQLDWMIAHEIKCVLRLERRAMTETDPTATNEKLFKTRIMLARMRAEQKGLMPCDRT